MVPASANVSGSVGTNWRTDLRLVNTENSPVLVRIHLLKNGQSNATLGNFVDVSVPADGVLIKEEVFTSTGERIGFLEAKRID